ncbi:MAG: hypothetical protein GYA55_12475 [SAR324 cluster bacterium]|uniref:Uncharacterized protein n=1 Tax=SAR324 cluster bacterium TaxID=2024889 RepID=A0A7X9IKR3_9DELT|nr:hypothetical protein [SAR324 cluster bacterium]
MENSTLKTWGADDELEKAFSEDPPMGLRRPVVSPAFGKKRQDQEPKAASSSLVGAGRKQDSLSMTSTRVLGQPSIKREVYRPRQQRYDEPEGPSLYRVLIYIFSALCFFLAIVVGFLIFQ